MTHEVSTRSLDETNVARIDAVCMRMRAACARSLGTEPLVRHAHAGDQDRRAV